MKRRIDWVKAMYQLVARRAACRTILGRLRDRRSPEKGRFNQRDVNELLKSAWNDYDRALPSLPRQPTRGSTMNVRLACFTFSVFTALLAKGSDREYAIELVADATWSVYQIWERLAAIAARLTPGKTTLGFAATRLRDSSGAASLKFPFNAPGYLIEPVKALRGVAFDVVRCPVASYFREHGAADLCVASWCNLDYALGEMTGHWLVRTKTLAQGADRCDFRIFPKTSTRRRFVNHGALTSTDP